MKKVFHLSATTPCRCLSNGNFYPRLSDPYAEGFSQELQEVTVFWKGEEYDGLMNASQNQLCIKEGYGTTANGSCSDLALSPGDVIIRTARGDGWSFSWYRIFSALDAE